MSKSYYGVAVLLIIAALWAMAVFFPKESTDRHGLVPQVEQCGEVGCT